MVLEYATTIGIKPAAARLGLNCETVRRWCDRWSTGGVEGLIPRYPKRRARPVSDSLRERIQQARQELHLEGKPVTQIAHLLGHSSPAIRRKIYAQWLHDVKTDTVANLARVVCGTALSSASSANKLH